MHSPCAALMVAVVTMACNHVTSPDPVRERALPLELREDAAAVVAATNQFACDLYRTVRDEPGNLVLSPYSIATALSMTYAGAQGVTAEEMAQVLHVPASPVQWHEASGALLSSLNRGAALGGYQLSVANRLWGQVGFSFLQPFLTLLREVYQAPLQQLDFVSAPEEARQTINGWVENQTLGKIRNLLLPGTIGPTTRLVLTNAIYFKGTWLTRFDPRETRPGPFWVTPTRSVPAELMRMKKARHRCAVREEAALLELPYRGKDLSMVLILPHERDGLGALEASLTAEKLEEWYRSLAEAEVEVVLPRWTFTSAFSLKDALSRMGMPTAFDPERADFSLMTGSPELFIGCVIHQAFVAVNEEGTVAAAATAVGMELTSMPAVFEATHPFVFYIRDNVTGVILFLGRVADPTAQ